jgi:hypothetical protein
MEWGSTPHGSSEDQTTTGPAMRTQVQEWFNAFTKFPPAAIFDAQHKISEILNKYFEE